jgi:hypothetical protein
MDAWSRFPSSIETTTPTHNSLWFGGCPPCRLIGPYGGGGWNRKGRIGAGIALDRVRRLQGAAKLQGIQILMRAQIRRLKHGPSARRLKPSVSAGRDMIELVRTNDPVIISFIEALMRDAKIEFLVADQNMSIMEGSLGVLPRRVLVDEGDLQQARRILHDAGIADEIRK